MQAVRARRTRLPLSTVQFAAPLLTKAATFFANLANALRTAAKDVKKQSSADSSNCADYDNANHLDEFSHGFSRQRYAAKRAEPYTSSGQAPSSTEIFVEPAPPE